MNTIYLDIFSGISGDMFLGAMIDLGIDSTRLERELRRLNLPGYHLRVVRGRKSSIEGVKFDVCLEPDHPHEHGDDDDEPHFHPHAVHAHGHAHAPSGAHGGPLVKISSGKVELSVFETKVPPRFRLYFSNAKGKSAAPAAANAVALETVRPDGTRQTFRFKQHKDYLEATEHLPEPHEFGVVLKLKGGSRTETHEVQFVEDHSHHHATEDHDHGPVHSPDHLHGRTFAEIKRLISTSSLSDWVKVKSLAVFHRIAVAEGKIHGLPAEKVHFHEVGAVDSIVDIVGACVALEMLGKPRLLAGSVVEGTGWVMCAHGRFPLPAPATLAILGARKIPLSQCEEPSELITPTGAALLAEFVEDFGPMRNLIAERIGFGLGQRDNKTRPNVLRAILGTSAQGRPLHDWQTDTIAVLEANLDDLNPEILGYFVEKGLAAGALDVFHTPIQMKKNRPGAQLTVLCDETEADRLTELMLRETSTFGVRRSFAERRKLEREMVSLPTPYGKVSVKLGRLDGKVIQAAPEFESCKALAEKANVPLKLVYAAANKAISAMTR